MAKKNFAKARGGRCTPHFRWWKIPLKTGIFGDDDDEESLCLSCYLVSILIRRDASSRVVSRPDHIIIIVTSNNNQPNQDCQEAVDDDDNRIVWSQEKYCGGIVLCFQSRDILRIFHIFQRWQVKSSSAEHFQGFLHQALLAGRPATAEPQY